MIETRLLRQFVVVAEELHFSRAANRLNMAQPPLSQAIKRLEEEVGARLFERDNRNVTLTGAGHDFLVTARKLLGELEEGVENARRIASGVAGRLSVSFIDTAHLEFLPPILRSFRQAFPDVELDLREGTTAQQIELLQSGEMDVGFMRWPGTPVTGLVFQRVQSEPVLVALPTGHTHAAAPQVPLAALADENFIASPRSEGLGFHDQMVGLCRSAGYSPRIVQFANQMQTIASLVAAGIGVALVPGSLAAIRRDNVVFRSIEVDAPEHELHIDLVLCRRAEKRGAVLDRFLDVVGSALAPSRDVSSGSDR
ncbi:LysR family transcriptional regulator [Sinorhizobium sp. BG8]|uniref:LysR family transcriptional regulator n=1 Tax=Sinorhizobium sp. BG8 TaxID=2613773 RepID=UPI00193DB442|nr:LysR family transcriptional regulator [Sinorhizobium sp. BG8]